MTAIGIVGLGLIGGSLGLDFRALGHRVLGVSRKQETCDRALARGVVDAASLSLSLMQEADIVFLCTPLSVMEATLIELRPHLTPDAIVTDVGSVKGWVMEAIAPYWANFIGGHPMAGTAESGIEAAQKDLFVGCTYVLTPSPSAPEASIQRLIKLIQPLQAEVLQCLPEEHDRAVAWISHLPVMVSASLITACLSEPNAAVLKLAETLASSGFRDTSRVGGGNPELGVMMATYNKLALVQALYAYRHQLNQVIADIEQDHWATLQDTLTQTQTARSRFQRLS
jgi:arogenate dehydrogenase (NADP+)